MIIYLKSINYELQDIVINRFIPSKNDFKEWNKEEKKIASLDTKSLNILFCAINQDKFNFISNCSTSHEAWYNLEVTHMEQVK